MSGGSKNDATGKKVAPSHPNIITRKESHGYPPGGEL
jgi:hypothetical protein